jgi:hypothetical protein
MNAFGAIFLLITAAAMLALPRRWAALPLLMGACYISPAQNVLLGPFHFTVLRLLLLIGGTRAMMRHERLPGGLNALDWLMVAWGAVTLGTSVFHKPFGDVLVYRLGIVYNAFGMYFLIRVYCQDTEELIQLLKIIAFLLVPVALEMINEKRTGRNLFAVLSGIPDAVEVRDGKLRANGPFGHAILAGTVGALCLPLMIGIWRQHRRPAIIGLAACLTMVIASKSSGPLMSLVIAVFALLLWRWRHLTRQMRIAAVLGYILLGIVMKDPPYFLMARIDLTGSSTGWYRAQLIRSAFQHFDEWWFAGTDHTRHWMATGLIIEDQADIVNHFLAQGVNGGLLLMGITIGWFWIAFRYVGRSLQLRREGPFAERFLIWSLGSSLFASAVTCLSVSYFEQSVMFLYFNLAAIGSIYAFALAEARGGSCSDFNVSRPAHSGSPQVVTAPQPEGGFVV